MMFPTHAVKGLITVMPLLYLYPDYTNLITISAVVGFNIPDIDLFVGKHRKTGHYPIVLGGTSAVFIIIVLTSHHPYLLVPSILFTGIWIHSLSDIIGGSVEDEPWEKTESKVVYNHLTSRWIDARRYITYDGSPEDLLLYTFLMLSFIVLYPTDIGSVEVSTIVFLSMFAVFYTIFRKSLFSPVYMEENYPKLKKISDKFLN